MSSIVSFLPLFLLFAIIAWIYVTYTVLFCFYYLDNLAKRYSYIAVTHILLVFFLWSLFESICQDHNAVPPQYQANLVNYNDAQFEQILRIIVYERRLQIVTRTELGTIRYCQHCQHIKPDRTHHCSSCNICVLKMDHHCPWIHNCVGYLNQKQFILMLLYGTIICSFLIFTISWELGKNLFNFHEAVMIDVGFLMTCFMGVSSLVLFVYNMITVLRNQTTIESLHSPFFEPDYLTFDQGFYENFAYVFGDQITLWLIPITTGIGNGYEFPVRVI